MSTGGSIICIAVFALVGWESLRGWHTGRVDYRALNGDRQKSPALYWFIMSFNVMLMVAILLVMLGIYGEPF